MLIDNRLNIAWTDYHEVVSVRFQVNAHERMSAQNISPFPNLQYVTNKCSSLAYVNNKATHLGSCGLVCKQDTYMQMSGGVTERSTES